MADATHDTAPSDAVEVRRECMSYHRVRVEQWCEVAPVFEGDLGCLLRAVADAEAVLNMAADLVGILQTDEVERDWDPGERVVTLSRMTRENLSAGMEAAARMASNQLADVQGRAADRLRRREVESTQRGRIEGQPPPTSKGGA